MADFVAVIRRAVDGLTENTPEMRVRVYDKARGAVVRQLENMNPRPQEAMFKRQLDKLDDAIRQVEDEHREALPAEPAPMEAAEPGATPAAEDTVPVEAAAIEPAPSVAETLPAETLAAETSEEAIADSAPEQILARVVPRVVAQEEIVEAASDAAIDDTPPYRLPHDGEDETFHYGSSEDPAAYDEAQPAVEHTAVEHKEQTQAAFVEPAQDTEVQAVPEREVVSHHFDAADDEPAITTNAAAEHDDPLLSHFTEPREPAIRHAANRVMEEPSVDAESEIPGAQQDATHVHAEPIAHEEHNASPTVATMSDWGVDIDREPEIVPEIVPQSDHEVVDENAPQMPRAALTETDVASGFSDFVKHEISTPVVTPPPVRKETESDFSWDAPFDDLPDLPKPVAFEQALHARQEEMAKVPEEVPEAKAERPRDARSELEDLIGYKPADEVSHDGQSEKFSSEVTRGMSKLEGKSFKINRKAKQKFNPIPIAFGVAAALVVAGGAFGAYTYREDVTKLVASYMPSNTAPAKTDTREVEAKATTDAKPKSVAVKTDDTAKVAQPADDEKPTEVASLDPSIVPSKFTQRLMADGSESETDAAKIPVDQSLTEGKTIAGQTVAAETEVASNDAKPATTTDKAAETPGLVVAQKMILYEERLGDSPVAVQGKVTWQLKNDTTNAGGKDQPMVEATVEVPERKLKAIVSFKRNADVSLPASHIIEVVFDLPDDFAEGNVESVQRIAFKQTEQDRGNSLIAVPAKITDDFHMIALNDDADARKVNTELMKTRSWIDIPVIYRNNRRALLTFEKGSTGTEAFDKALAAWAALGPTANN